MAPSNPKTTILLDILQHYDFFVECNSFEKIIYCLNKEFYVLKKGLNLVIITLDGARIDRIQNSEVINELSKSGTIFNHMITYAPYTISSMHAIFSGEFGFNTGVDSYWSTYKFKKEKFKTLTQYLHENNFETHGDAINELVIPPQGFDDLQYHDEDKDDLLDRHKKLLDKMSKLESGKNFFLYLHYSNIHTNIKNSVLRKFNNFSEEYFENHLQNEKNYDRYFSDAEDYLRKIFEYCKTISLWDNTLFVVLSDHGISTGDKFGERAYGAFLYDYTVKTFALFIDHNIFPSEIIDRQVRTIDIMPTILDVFKIPHDLSYSSISGRSLLPIISGLDGESRTAIIETGNPLESDRPPKSPNVVAIRKNGWKLILNMHDGSMELYDLSSDPSEKQNLINSEKHVKQLLLDELLSLNPRKLL